MVFQRFLCSGEIMKFDKYVSSGRFNHHIENHIYEEIVGVEPLKTSYLIGFKSRKGTTNPQLLLPLVYVLVYYPGEVVDLLET